ncbi:MAG: hypothetical protein HC822_00735 [Oscillochloris sp.]|nr:hypothetical protein [Oscillochloris sp.]
MQHIAQALAVDIVLVNELVNDQLHTLASWSEGSLQPAFSYAVAGNPCSLTLRDGLFIQPDSLQQSFQLPDIPGWKHATSYLGIALYDLNRRPFGNLCILSRRPLQTPQRAMELLQLFAARAAAELERQRAIRSLEQLNRDLESIVAKRTAELQTANEQLMAVNIELEQATRAKDTFLAAMSHELRTPLHAVLGMAESLQEGIYGPINDRQQQAIETIDQSGRHLLTLINDILDLAKIASGKLEIVPEPVYLTWLAENSLIFVREQALRKRIKLSSTIIPELRERQVILDELRIRQALINLLANAVSYTPLEGHVQIVIALDNADNPEQIVIHVIDNGIGIAAADLDRIFEPFEQIGPSSGRAKGGSGLGLALVRQIIELHGGRIHVESTLGEGSRFTILLPYVKA